MDDNEFFAAPAQCRKPWSTSCRLSVCVCVRLSQSQYRDIVNTAVFYFRFTQFNKNIIEKVCNSELPETFAIKTVNIKFNLFLLDSLNVCQCYLYCTAFIIIRCVCCSGIDLICIYRYSTNIISWLTTLKSEQSIVVNSTASDNEIAESIHNALLDRVHALPIFTIDELTCVANQ